MIVQHHEQLDPVLVAETVDEPRRGRVRVNHALATEDEDGEGQLIEDRTQAHCRQRGRAVAASTCRAGRRHGAKRRMISAMIRATRSTPPNRISRRWLSASD